MSARTWSMVCVAAAGAATLGCQQTRRIVVTSEPTGALVTLNDVEVGRTPVEVDFTWFGAYDVRLSKEGYEPLWTSAEAEPKLHDQPGLDLLAAFVPGGTETIVEWHFELEPLVVNQRMLLDRADDARSMLEGPEGGRD